MTYTEGTQQNWEMMSAAVTELRNCVSTIREEIGTGLKLVTDLKTGWSDRASEEFGAVVSEKANEVEDLMQLFEQYAKALEDYVAQSRSDVEAGTQRIRNIG